MDDSEQTIARYLSSFREEIRDFAQELRAFIKEETKPAYELAGQSAQSFNIGYGFTTTAWDCYCAIIVYRKHINISLPSGASLSDPHGLLHGTGSRVRHLKLKSLEDVQLPEVRQILNEARKKAAFLIKEKQLGHEGVKTVIRSRKAK